MDLNWSDAPTVCADAKLVDGNWVLTINCDCGTKHHHNGGRRSDYREPAGGFYFRPCAKTPTLYRVEVRSQPPCSGKPLYTRADFERYGAKHKVTVLIEPERTHSDPPASVRENAGEAVRPRERQGGYRR